MRNSLLRMIQAARDVYQATSDQMEGRFNFTNQEDDGFFNPEEAVEFTTDGDETVVRIAGPIDDLYGVDTRAIIEELDRVQPNKLRLLIDSPGGYVDEGLALYTDLRARARNGVSVATETRGIVASAASVIFLAGDQRSLTPGSMVMIHPPSGYLDILMFGTAEEIEQRAQPEVDRKLRDLRAIETNLMEIYVDRLPDTNREELDKLIQDEQLLTAEQAAAAGFGDVVEEPGNTSDPKSTNTQPDAAVLALHSHVMDRLKLEGFAA